MRFYQNFPEALNELRRELAEMGIRVKTQSVQNIDISNNPDYESMELQNYTYTVTSPDWRQLPLNNAAWCEAEFAERISGEEINPGRAWELRRAYWEQFLNHQGQFDYAYPVRMAKPLKRVIETLKKDPFSRRAFLSVWDREADHPELQVRVSCSLGYWFVFRQNKLSVTYLQRSADFSEHFANDIYLADRLKCYVADQLSLEKGPFIHWLGSLHCFQKDVAGVF